MPSGEAANWLSSDREMPNSNSGPGHLDFEFVAVGECLDGWQLVVRYGDACDFLGLELARKAAVEIVDPLHGSWEEARLPLSFLGGTA